VTRDVNEARRYTRPRPWPGPEGVYGLHSTWHVYGNYKAVYYVFLTPASVIVQHVDYIFFFISRKSETAGTKLLSQDVMCYVNVRSKAALSTARPKIKRVNNNKKKKTVEQNKIILNALLACLAYLK